MDNETKYYETKKYRCLEYHQKQTESLYMLLCGIEDCEPGKRFYTECRAGYHLHVIMSGKGRLCVNNATYDLHFGQMFITKPNEDCWYEPDAIDPWSYCWIAFDGENAKYYAESAGFKDGVYWLDCCVETQKFYEMIQRILQHPELNLANDLLRLGVLCEYISLAIESKYKSAQVIRNSHEYAPDVYVKHALDYIRMYYDTIKINDVAKYIGINRSYLTNIFKKKLGVSPQEYLLQYRLNKSCQLLLETHLPIQEIAQRIGYDNPLTFSKMFKNAYGLSPRNYRLKNSENVETPVQ